MPKKLSARQASREYRSWATMIQRCCNPNNSSYVRYGARGIAVCDHWRIYENFLADMGPRPPDMTLERVDNDKGYEPGNCCWATRKEQSRNRRSNKMITFQGVTLCVTDWAKRQGIPKQALQDRLWRGWPVETALTLPASPSNSIKLRERGKGKVLTHNGETLSILTWAERYGLKHNTIHFRLSKGWSVEAAITTPARPKRQGP